MKNYKQRLLVEFRDLIEKRTLLQKYISSLKETKEDEATLLNRQMDAMMSYEEILFIRLSKIMGVE